MTFVAIHFKGVVWVDDDGDDPGEKVLEAFKVAFPHHTGVDFDISDPASPESKRRAGLICEECSEVVADYAENVGDRCSPDYFLLCDRCKDILDA